jgi:Malectin domain/Right handed beta helix region/Periplasmic copper-binding protein (NosD)
LRVVWAATVKTASGGLDDVLRTLSWNGTAFVADQPTDLTGTGIGDLHGAPLRLALTLDPSGRAWLASDTPGGTGFSVRAGATPAAHVFVADATHTIQSILSGGAITAGDLILVAATTTDTDITLGAPASGIAIVGLDGVSFAHGFAINGANGVTIRNLDIAGAVSVTGASGVSLAENTFHSHVTISNATGLLARDNKFLGADQGLVIASASDGKIVSNTFVGSAQDLVINAVFTGSITANDISGGGTGVVYAAVAPLAGNRIHNNPTGIATSLAAQNVALGFAAGTGSNDIFQNTLGVQMTGASLSGQHIFNNTTGVSGSGVLGGNDMSGANLIAGNQTGVASFNGTIHYNRIEGNGVGIAATSAQVIFDNQILSNTTAGILVSGVTKVEIAGNTIRAFVGDGVRLVNQANNIELIDNIIWADSGYGIYVANDSQTGFWSDYNTLFADGTGKIVYWTKDFVDILDWQDDVAQFDLHSDGVTVVNPRWAQPHFGMGFDGVTTARPLVADQRLTDPTTSGGDPAGSFIRYRGVPNLLINGSFESALTGWTVTSGGAATASGPSAWDGSSVFTSGPAGSAVAQQSIDLVAAGFSAGTIDSGSLQVAFGGRVELTNGSQQAQISLVFRDKDGNAIGTPVVVAAGTDVGRWQRLFDTVYIPTGARTAQYLFGVTNANSSTGAALDQAFLGIIPRGGSTVSQGDVPPNTTVPLDATNGRLALRSPDLYVDWQLNTPKFITWDSFGAAAGSAVRIELWQDSPSGTHFLSLITASTPDTGRFAWTPSANGLTYGTYGLHIRIISVANPSVYDMSTEPFTVPENGNTYYVNDASTTGDQYTTAPGSNRNDGKLPSAPKPNPVNLFRVYDITAGATVYIDTGNYPLIYTLQLSGSVDRGLGLDTAFTIDGPTNAGATAAMLTAIPGARPAALIDLLDADFVTLRNLTLQGATRAVYVYGGSDTFSAYSLTATGQSGNAFDITTTSPNGVLDHLTATGAGGDGLLFNGSIQVITYFTGTGNQDGIVATGTIGSIANSTLSNNRAYGLNLQVSAGATTLEGNTFSGNSTGVYVSTFGSGSIVFGNANLGLGLGNNVFGNTYLGVRAEGATQVVGDSIHDNVGAQGLWVRNGASATDNLVYGNATGIELDTGTTLQGNRVYANTTWGISATSGGNVINNVIYSNGVGLYVSGQNTTVRNNLIYADVYAGLRFTNGSGLVSNNTFYEPTAGTINDGSSYGAAAVDIDRGVSSITLTDNIIVALAGVGIRVADAAQAGFVSDYNLFNTGSGGRVGSWLGLDRTSLAQWRSATQRDPNSRFADPSFVNPTGPDGVLGYGSPTADGSDDDFHVKSLNGSFHGGSLAVVRNPATGLPVFPTVTLTNDAVNSTAIDRGDPSVPVGAEPAPNGNIVEVGAYGGTAQASLSPAAFLAVVSPDGGETLFQGATATIKWNTFNVSGTVDLAATTDGVNFTTIATGVANNGQYSWTVDGNVFAAGATYQVRVSSTATPTIFGISEQVFTISAPVHAYYINDNSTVGDQYTTAVGNDANSGLTPDAPMATFQALLTKYSLHGGDTVYVDTGNYALSTNIVFTSDDSGTSDTSRVVVQGPTSAGSTATFDRTNRSSGFYAFEFKGAQFVSLQNLHITGGNYGVVADDNAKSLNITLANDTIDGNSNGVYVGVGDNSFLVSGSTLTAQSSGSGSGVYMNQATGTTVTGSTFSNFQWGVNLNSTTNTIVRADNFINDTGATTTSFDYNILFDQLTVSGGYYGISTYRVNGVIQNSVVHDTQAYGIGADAYSPSGQTLLATGNTIYNIGGSNAFAAALTVSGALSTATNNVIYSSAEGISVSGGYATGNRVFNVSDVGIDVGYYGNAIGNKVYDNGIGILAVGSNATLTNNTIYDNAIGIQVNLNNNGPNTYIITSNTIVQPSGTAIKLVGNANTYTVRDNIISLGATALGLDAPASAQIGYKSDYNLWDLTAGAKVVSWAGQVLTLDQVKTQLGLDTNSFAANPLFNNPAGADGVRGFVGGVDHGADDDFSLQAGSPAIDRGDPTAPFFNEPVGANFGDGARIDIGAGGNSANAAQSPSQLVQLLGQTGGQRYQVGQTANITFRSDGLVGQDPVLFLNVGGGQVVGTQSWNVFQADQFRLAGNSYNRTNGKAVDTSNVDAPAAVFQTLADLNYNSPSIAYGIPLADGNYQVKLLFDDPDATAVGQRKFDIVANGVTVQSNYDIFAAAGGANKAVAYTFDTSATGGKGLRIDLMLKTGDVILSGIEITRILPPQPTWTAAIDVSLDNGATWTNIASGLSLDRLGDGSFAWTPTAATAGTQGLLRITATDGVHTVADQSIAPFMIAPGGHSYYVNDGSTAGDVYTTAVGNDANSGKTADAPMASLASLLSLYKLQPGDNVYIDSGTYSLSSNLVLGAGVSGTPGNPINFIGAGTSTILARVGTAASTDVIDVNGAHDLSFSNMALTGGQDGFDINDFSNSTDITLSGFDISKFGNSNYSYGIFDGVGSLGFSLTGSTIHDSVGTNFQAGLKLSDPTNYQTANATVTGNVFKNLSDGIQGAYNNNVTIANNTFSGNSGAAISVGQSIVNGAVLNVTGNIVTGGGGLGIDVSAAYAGSVVVSGNTVSGISNGTGIQVFGPLLAQNNVTFGNYYGFSAGAGSIDVGNLIHDNTAIGVTTRGNAYGAANLIGNTIYNNPIGLDVYITGVSLRNNVFYNNTQMAVYGEYTNYLVLENNIIDQSGGTAVAGPCRARSRGATGTPILAPIIPRKARR